MQRRIEVLSVFLGLLILILATSLVFAQGQSVRQSGASVTPGTIPYWVTNGVIGDSVTAADSPVTSFGVTSAGSQGNCVNSARVSSGAWISICQGFVSGVPTITVQNNGSATPQPLQFIVNGTTFPFPGALSSIILGSTPIAGGAVVGDCLTVGAAALLSQTGCSILTAGTTGTGAVVLANSPTLIGTIGGNLTFSGTHLLNGSTTAAANLIVNGITTPASAAGNTVVLGTVTAPALTNTGQAFLFNTAINGAILEGDGSSFDLTLANKNGAAALQIATGSTGVTLPGVPVLSGLSSGTCSSGLAINSSNQVITASCPGAAASIQVGTTTVTSGTTANILFNNAGTLGNETIASILTGGTGITISGTTNATIALSAARQTLPTHQVFLSGSGTYTTPANTLWIEITLVGGGGGGGGGNSATPATSGGNTCWNTSGAACTSPVYQAGGGGGSTTNSGAIGAISGSGTCDWSVAGTLGQTGSLSIASTVSAPGGAGGNSTLGGGGNSISGSNGNNATPNSGAGGGGGGNGSANTTSTGAGGPSGATCHVIINTPAATYTYAVGAGGAGAAGGANGFTGGSGAAGQIIVYEHYGS